MHLSLAGILQEWSREAATGATNALLALIIVIAIEGFGWDLVSSASTSASGSAWSRGDLDLDLGLRSERFPDRSLGDPDPPGDLGRSDLALVYSRAEPFGRRAPPVMSSSIASVRVKASWSAQSSRVGLASSRFKRRGAAFGPAFSSARHGRLR